MAGRSLFGGLGLTRRVAGSEPPAQKLLAKRPGKFDYNPTMRSKNISHCSGHTDGRTDGRTDKRTSGRTDGQKDRQTERQTDRQTERQTDRLKFFFLNYFIAGGDRKL